MRLKNSLLIILIVVFVGFQCSTELTTAGEKNKDQTVLIFHNINSLDTIKDFYKPPKSAYKIYVNNLPDSTIEWTLNSLANTDTIVVENFPYENIELEWWREDGKLHPPFLYTPYLIRRGDTTHLTFKGGEIFAEGNSSRATRALNFIITDLNKPLTEIYSKVKQKKIEREIWNSEAPKVLSKAFQKVDSMKQYGELTTTEALLYKLVISTRNLKDFDETIFRVNHPQLANDSLLNSKWYKFNIRRIYKSKIRTVMVKSSGYIGLDICKTYPAIYKGIVADKTLLPPWTFDYLLKDAALTLANDCGQVDLVNTYIRKLREDVRDSTTYRQFQRERGGLSEFISTADEIELIDPNGNRFDFKDIQNRDSGKLLYIDFWASWCIPCRHQFPASRKLKEEYWGKDLALVYLSIDRNQKDWLEANEKEMLTENSYLIANPQSAEMMKKLKVRSIPRYLIYDKTGRLVHSDAPRPDDTRLKELFEKYLEE